MDNNRISQREIESLYDKFPASPYELQDQDNRSAYVHALMRDRNQTLRQNPSVAPYLDSITGGATGAGLGYVGGHGLNSLLKSVVKPEIYGHGNYGKNMGRMGMFLGGALGAANGALNKTNEITLANKMRNPENLQTYLNQIGSSESYF